MVYIDHIETDSQNYASKWNEDYKIWRSARVLDTYVFGGGVFGDGSYCKSSYLGVSVLLNRGAFVLKSTVGDKSQIGFNTKILYAQVGKYCSISWDCSIGGSNHNIHAVSTFNMRGETHYGETKCIIGNDVWIGAGVNVLRNVIVGDGAVVGAGSVVTHDVLPYEIVAGVPAKHIGWRFEESIRDRMLRIQWWNFPVAVVEENALLFGMEVSEDVLVKLESLINVQTDRK